MNLRETRRSRVIFSVILLIVALIVKFTISENTFTSIAFLMAWIISGIDIIYQAFLNLKSKMLLAEHFL
ncbi:hypothetical protein, partial [Rhodovulum adriaticum]|uniref:hypothetical protein n=1 Tax=Rhodovulum adriaticum TaxID=35804 RepID=UPI001A92E1DD